jgi:hypothetical protein
MKGAKLMQPNFQTLGYDSLKFRLKTEDGRKILPLLESFEERTDSKTGGMYYIGQYRNLYFTVNDNGITVRNSIARFHHGDNSRLLSPTELKSALESLSESFGLNFYDADIQRIDFAGDIILHSPVPQYLAIAVRLPRLKKGTDGDGTTVYFKSKNREVKLYDKVAECKAHKSKVPITYKGKNVLRIEESYIGRINQQFGFSVKMLHLTSDAFYNDLCERWRQQCNVIQMVAPYPAITGSFQNKADMEGIIMRAGIRSIGCERIETAIGLEPDRKKRHKMKNALREAESYSGTAWLPSLNKEFSGGIQALYTNSTASTIPE